MYKLYNQNIIKSKHLKIDFFKSNEGILKQKRINKRYIKHGDNNDNILTFNGWATTINICTHVQKGTAETTCVAETVRQTFESILTFDICVGIHYCFENLNNGCTRLN